MYNSWALSHPWLHRGRLTCMPLHSAANYFPLQASTAVLTQILTHSATAFEEYFPPTPSMKKKLHQVCLWNQLISIRLALSSPEVFITNGLKAAIIVFVLWPVLWRRPWGKTQGWDFTDAELRHQRWSSLGPNPAFPLKCGSHKPHWGIILASSQPLELFIVNNLKHCLKGKGRQESVTAGHALKHIQRPAKSAWLMIRTKTVS